MIEISLLILGICLHWLGCLIEIKRSTGEMPNVIEAAKNQPLHIAKTSIVALAVGVALYDMGQLNPASALFLGLSADRAASILKRKAKV